jgi:hypothetical protein
MNLTAQKPQSSPQAMMIIGLILVIAGGAVGFLV